MRRSTMGSGRQHNHWADTGSEPDNLGGGKPKGRGNAKAKAKADAGWGRRPTVSRPGCRAAVLASALGTARQP